MANVLITSRCNLRCPYCFAQERLKQSAGPSLMALADVSKLIEFLKRSSHPQLRLMGGEPTLHPEFQEIVQMGLRAEMSIDLLSNATWPNGYNALFRKIPPGRLRFLLNVDHPSRYAPGVWAKIQRNVAAVAQHGSTTLSFNVFEEEPRYDYLINLVKEYGIRTIRLSMALPIYGESNASLGLDALRRMGPFVVRFTRELAEVGAHVAIDNALPLCMFTYEEAGELLLKGVLDLGRNARCEPVIDIGPDLSVWCCFCLSRLWHRHLDEFTDLGEIVAYYRRALSLYQGRRYPLPECGNCQYAETWGCQGGCLTYTLNRHGVLNPELLTGQSFAAMPLTADSRLRLRERVELRDCELPTRALILVDTASGSAMEVSPLLAPILKSLDGNASLRECFRQLPGASSVSELSQSANRLIEDRLLDILAGFVEAGFIEENETPSVCPREYASA